MPQMFPISMVLIYVYVCLLFCLLLIRIYWLLSKPNCNVVLWTGDLLPVPQNQKW